MIAHRQEISLKYIEQVMPLLTGAGMVEGIHGRGGGYRLCMEPTEIRIGDILRLTEGDLAPVACLSGKAGGTGIRLQQNPKTASAYRCSGGSPSRSI